MVPWVGLRCVIVVFPHHTHLLLALEALFLLKLIKARKLTYKEKMHKYLDLMCETYFNYPFLILQNYTIFSIVIIPLMTSQLDLHII